MTATATQIAQVPLFAHMTPDTQEAIARNMTVRTLPAGHEIVTEGEGGIGFFILTDGTAEVMHGDEAGGRVTLKPGDSFGEIALLDSGARSATVRASTDVTCLILTRWDFLAVLRADAGLGVDLLKAMAKRVRALEARIAQLEAAGARA